jgi:hypothetical protein
VELWYTNQPPYIYSDRSLAQYFARGKFFRPAGNSRENPFSSRRSAEPLLLPTALLRFPLTKQACLLCLGIAIAPGVYYRLFMVVLLFLETIHV